MDELRLSSLGHTWILDLDGSVLKHRGYEVDGRDSFLPGAEEFLKKIPSKDMVVFITSRREENRAETESFLHQNGIRFEHIIFNAPYGERVLINDDKPSGLRMGYALSLTRDAGIQFRVTEDEEL